MLPTDLRVKLHGAITQWLTNMIGRVGQFILSTRRFRVFWSTVQFHTTDYTELKCHRFRKPFVDYELRCDCTPGINTSHEVLKGMAQ